MLIQGPVVNRDLCFRAFLTSNSDSSPQNWSRVKWGLKKNDFEIFWNFLVNLGTGRVQYLQEIGNFEVAIELLSHKLVILANDSI